MRALVLISGLATGGAERVTVSFLRRLAGSQHVGIACTVTSRHDGPLANELRAGGVVRHDLGASRLADPRAFARFLDVLTMEQPDVIHAHGQDASILAATTRQVSRVPLVITRHVLEEPAGNCRQALRARMALWAARRADAVVAVSLAAADWLARLAGLPRRRICVIPNGVDFEHFPAANLDTRGAALRQKLGFSARDRIVLVPAALRRGKGHDILLDAVPFLQRRVSGLRVVLAGSGEREEFLRKRAESLRESVVFIGDFPDMPAAYAACDLVVLPSDSEALPTALMEAAAAGRPVVATRVGGTGEVVAEGRTGLLVPPRDSEALAEAVAALLTDAGRAAAFGLAARRHAEENFSIDLQMERTLKVWADAIERGTG